MCNSKQYFQSCYGIVYDERFIIFEKLTLKELITLNETEICD